LSRADELLPVQHANTPKLMREHRLVVEAIARALAPVCGSLKYPGQPRLLRLRDLLHLWTEVRAQAKPGQTLLSLAARLHPTPAVNGAPRAPALDWLRRHEPFRRGWYAGGGGWLDPAGDGDLAVLLRSALLDARGAELYAGAGILSDSDPRAEYAETELKLRTIQRALRGAGAAGAPLRAAGE
jgi:menaquinone-specific isochorismate synthase